MIETVTQAHLITALLAYLVGSIPFGMVLTKLTGTADLRQIGSGNIGATNVLRTGRKGLAAATLLLDGGKGAVVALIAHSYALDLAIIAGLCSVVGHNFPVWLKFKGGKGVATSLGVLLAVSWPVGLLACVTWLLTAAIFRYSSLAALLGLLAAPFYAWGLAGQEVAVMAAILAILSFVRHHENIRRLLAGEESKIGGIKKDAGN